MILGFLSFASELCMDSVRVLVQWWQRAALILMLLSVLYTASLSIYRLFFSPLSNVPGPKLAALTYLYEGYYEVWLGGKYFRRVAEMHRQYGPIIRITPHEVHFADPELLDTLYPTTGRKTDKPPVYALITGTPHSVVSTRYHEQHRQRRNALSSFFSPASIHKSEHILKYNLKRMLARLDTTAQANRIVNIHDVFKAATSDIITKYAFGTSFNFLDMPDYGQPYFDATQNFLLLTHLCVLIPWIYPLIQSLPDRPLRLLFPSLSEIRDRQNWWMDRVRAIRTSSDAQLMKESIFGGILTSKLPLEEKSDIRMANEAQLVVIAGEGTTAWSLHAALFEMLSHPEEVKKLKVELSSLELDEDGLPSISQVEALPYLGAIIQEAVRLHPGVLTRQMRISPELPITYDDENSGRTYVLPPGVITSMSPHVTHHDPKIFTDPYEFRPQRWIDNPKLARYFHGFARGSRNCVGMTLARCEMALVLSTLFLRYDLYKGQSGPTMELYDTNSERDVKADSDYIIPVLAKDSQGVRIKLRA